MPMGRWTKMSGKYTYSVPDLDVETPTRRHHKTTDIAVCTILMQTTDTFNPEWISLIKGLCSAYHLYDVIVFTNVEVSQIPEVSNLIVVSLYDLKRSMQDDARDVDVDGMMRNVKAGVVSAYGWIDLMKMGATMYLHKYEYTYVWYIDLFKMCFSPITEQMYDKVDEVGLLMALYENGDEKWAHFTQKKVLSVVGDVYKQLNAFSSPYTFENSSVLSRWVNHLIVVFLNSQQVFKDDKFTCCGHAFDRNDLYRLMHRSNYIHVRQPGSSIPRLPLLSNLVVRDVIEVPPHTTFTKTGFFYSTSDPVSSQYKLKDAVTVYEIEPVSMHDKSQYVHLDEWAITEVLKRNPMVAWFDGDKLFTLPSNMESDFQRRAFYARGRMSHRRGEGIYTTLDSDSDSDDGL